MFNLILSSLINSKLNDVLQLDDKSIIVLKGIPMEVVDETNASCVRIDEVANDKFGYFMKINGNRNRQQKKCKRKNRNSGMAVVL